MSKQMAASIWRRPFAYLVQASRLILELPNRRVVRTCGPLLERQLALDFRQYFHAPRTVKASRLDCLDEALHVEYAFTRQTAFVAGVHPQRLALATGPAGRLGG